MEEAKPSVMRLDEISLSELSFKKKSRKLRSNRIPSSSIKMSAEVVEISETTCFTRCEFVLYGDDDPRGDFEMTMKYEVTASVEGAEHQKDLEMFARYGASFNALVFARDLAASVTSKCFGRSALLPLIDIREFGKQLAIKRPQANPLRTGHEPSEPS